MAIDVQCDLCGDQRRVLTAPFRCPCGGTMQNTARPADLLVGTIPRRPLLRAQGGATEGRPPLPAEPAKGPNHRGVAWASISFGGLLVLGAIALFFLASFAEREEMRAEIPDISDADISLLRTFGVFQLLAAALIIGGGIVLLATEGCFVWLLQGGLAGFLLLRIVDFLLTLKGPNLASGSCGMFMAMGAAVVLMVLTERHRRAISG